MSETGERIPTVTDSNFTALVLEGQGPIAVEFMSYGCAHCGAIEPVLQQVAEILEARVSIFRVNIGLDPNLAERFQIQGTPTLVMFLDGGEVGRVEGPSPDVSSLSAEISQAFGQ